MTLTSLKCPNCGANYNPSKYLCEYCGAYVIMSDEKYLDLSEVIFKATSKINDEKEKYPGIYVFGRLLGKGERPITLGFANYFTGIISAGGKLLLTNQSLSFSAHGINIGRKECKINLIDIKDVQVALNLFISQHIIVSTEKDTHRFVVYHGKDWVKNIKEAMRHTEEIFDISSNNDFISSDYSIELRKLKSLLDDGIITQEEYNIKKRTILKI